jgi:hypothetical protein
MILAYPYATQHAQIQHYRLLMAWPHNPYEVNKMLQNRPIANFFAKLALSTALLLTGDYFDFIELTQQALHFTGQTLASSTEPQRMARGG